jgi:hypothetical protein
MQRIPGNGVRSDRYLHKFENRYSYSRKGKSLRAKTAVLDAHSSREPTLRKGLRFRIHIAQRRGSSRSISVPAAGQFSMAQ